MPQGNSSGGASPRSQNGRTSQAGNRCRPEIVLAYAITGFGIVVLSGLTTKVYNVPLSAQLGLFQLLPPAYWIGLSLIAASTVISAWRGSDVLVAVTGIILLATLAGTPSLFEPTPRYWDAYVHFAESQSFMVSGRLSSNPSSYSANWPGAFLVIWTVSAASGVPSIEFLGLFPFLTGGLTFLAIFELVRSIFGPVVARQVSVPTALFAVWAQYHVSPQSLGFVLLLMVLATCRRRETTWRLIAVTLFGGLVVSHPTSSILLLSVLGLNAGLSSMPWFHGDVSREEARAEGRMSRRVAVTFAIVWLAWLFFLAVGSSEAAKFAVLTRMEDVLLVPEQTVNVATHRTSESLLTWAPLIRFASMGIYGLAGIVSLVALFRDRGSRGLFRLGLSALIGPGLVAAADIFGFGGQFYDRSLLLIATFVPALCFAGLGKIRMPKGLRRGALVVLVCASVATASTTYYLEAFNLVPVESIAAANFSNTLPAGCVVMDGKFPVPVWIDPARRSLIYHFDFSQVYPIPLSYVGGQVTTYAAYDPTAELWYRQWYGSEIWGFYSSEQANNSLIYDNGWTRIYAVSP